MFNGKVGPSDYTEVRDVLFAFLGAHKLSINEAYDVLLRLHEDVGDMVCSGVVDDTKRSNVGGCDCVSASESEPFICKSSDCDASCSCD